MPMQTGEAVCLWLPLATAAAAIAGPPTPCTRAADCLSHFELPGVGPKLALYGSFDLARDNPQVTQAILIVHGAGGNADGYFKTATRAVAAAGAAERTLVVAPHFQSLGAKGNCPFGVERPAEGALYWSCQGWKEGEAAVNGPVTSFAVLDALIDALAARFSRLERIAVAGHSAGAQVVLRYAAASRLPAGRVAVRLVAANPSSYCYLDGHRPRDAARCTPTGCPDGFAPFPAEQCKGFDDWKYGLQNLSGAAAGSTARRLRQAYLSRRIVYLLGERDSSKDEVARYDELDKTCAANAQGPFRLHRGLAFMSYLRERFGQEPEFHVMAGCGHSAACMFASEEGRRALLR